MKNLENYGNITFEKNFKESEEGQIKLKNYFKGFGFLWSITILIINIIVSFSSMLWICYIKFPNGLNLGIEIFCEIMIAIDFFLKFYMKKFEKENSLMFMKLIYFNTTKEKINFFFLMISSIPFLIFFAIIKNQYNLNLDGFTFLEIIFALKLIRIMEISLFLYKIKEILIYSTMEFLIIFKLFENILILLASTHFSACSWIFVNKIENNSQNFIL